MSVSDECKKIAEAIGCTFFDGTLQELNIDIESGEINKDTWILGLITPEKLTDSMGSDNPMFETTYPMSAFIARQDSDQTIDHRTKDKQAIYDAALSLARKFVHKFTELDTINQPPSKVIYFMIDSNQLGQIFGLDLHLFGVGIQCEFVISEGLTGCEL
jgi:hypothetical protein